MRRPLVFLALALGELSGATLHAEEPVPVSTAAPPPEDAGSPAPPPRRIVTLAQVEKSALSRHPQIAQSKAQTRAALARAAQSESGFYPQVTANAGYTRGTANFVQKPGALPSSISVRTKSSFDTFDSYTFGLTASQLVYDFGQTVGTYHAAQANAESQAASEVSTRQGVLLAARTAYSLAWANRALVGVAHQTLENADRHLRQIEGLVKVGVRPEIDLAQVRADRANAELQRINAENAYETAKAQLNQTMGVEESTDYDVGDERLPAVSGEEADESRLVELAVATRPELRSLSKQVEANDRQISATRGGYGPSLGVSSSLTEGGRDITALTWNWNAGANLTWPLFQGGVTNARVREAEANRDATRSQIALERQQIRLEITQARFALRGAKAALEASREVEKNARERLRLAEARYQAGAGSIIELEDAEVAETTASGQVVQADYGLSVARAQLEKGLGRE